MSPQLTVNEKARRHKRMKVLTRAYLFLLVLGFFLLAFFPRVVHFVEAGEGGVLFRRLFGGVVTTRVYGEGIHLTFPWDTLTTYDVRIQEKSMNFTVLSENGLSIDIDLSVRYHPEYDTLGLLHKRVGPDYVDKIVAPVVEGSVRDTAGKFSAEDFYASQGPLLQEIDNQVRSELAQFFIVLEGLTVKRIELPSVIGNAIEAKEEQRERLLAYEYRLRSEKEETIRKQIEALGWANYNRMVGRSLSPSLLQWRGIDATLKLAASNNSKVVMIGNGAQGMPVILGSDYTSSPGATPAQLADDSNSFPAGIEAFAGLDTRIKKMRSVFDELLRRNRVDPGRVPAGIEAPTPP